MPIAKEKQNHKPKHDELNEGSGVLHISSVVIWLNDDDGDKGNHSLAYLYSSAVAYDSKKKTRKNIKRYETS